MEEQKNKNKEIKLSTEEYSNKEDAPVAKSEKLTYEQLNNACVQLSQENQYLKKQLMQANKVLNTFNRLDYLFRVIECDHNNKINSTSFDRNFVEKCVSEVQEIMTIPETKEEDDKEN